MSSKKSIRLCVAAVAAWVALAFGIAARADCQPDPELGPTIELSWSQEEPGNVEGWRVYRSARFRPKWELVRTLRPVCFAWDAWDRPVPCGDAAEHVREVRTPGVDFLVAVAEQEPLEDGWASHAEYDLAVEAYNAAGVSGLSPAARVCWPLWLQELGP